MFSGDTFLLVVDIFRYFSNVLNLLYIHTDNSAFTCLKGVFRELQSACDYVTLKVIILLQ